jgi:Transposase DDE domain
LVETVNLERYGVGRFGDARLEARGALLHEALIANPGCRVRRVAGGARRKEMGFTRFLYNRRVTPRELSRAAAARVAKAVEGREVLAIQDTSQIVLGNREKAAQGYGPVGKGGNLRGVLIHPVLAVDATSGDLLGLVDVEVWNRRKRVTKARTRPKAERESRRWGDGTARAAEVLAKARGVTVVMDREGDDFHDFVHRPENAHILTRVKHDRKIETGEPGKDMVLSRYVKDLPEAERFTIDVPPAPGRAARRAKLALRFAPVTIKAPRSGMRAQERKALPASVRLHVVEVREVDAPDGVEPLRWLLLTSHEVADCAQARRIVGFYRLRWIVEEYFRTLKSAGFQLEDSDLSDPEAFMNLAAMAAIAAVAVTQLLRARDNPGGQTLLDAFDAKDEQMIEAICADYEGPSPTRRQTNPHPQGTMARATWVIARLGGWTAYYGKPGPRTLNRGFERFNAIRYGARLKAKDV